MSQKFIAPYERLSYDSELKGESNSISSQEVICKLNEMSDIGYAADIGHSRSLSSDMYFSVTLLVVETAFYSFGVMFW